MNLRYIKASNNTPRLPLTSGAVWFLLLERFQAPGWAFGVLATIFAVFLVANVAAMVIGKAVDVCDK